MLSGFQSRLARIAPCALAIAVIAVSSDATVAAAEQPRPLASAPVPFTQTLSNNVPLAFGMDPSSVAAALGTPLYHVSGRPGDEVLMAIREGGGTGLLPRRDRLYLQFRGGRLTGWKGDWGHNWMWR